MRGGLPYQYQDGSILCWSLPRARGFTVQLTIAKTTTDVSPPCAGVYPGRRRQQDLRGRLSPVRRGLPTVDGIDFGEYLSLPRARGFTELVQDRALDELVSPPCAGFYRPRPWA